MQLNMRKFRKNAGLTLQTAANRLGLDYTQLSKIERGESDTGIRRLDDMASLYGCAPADLIANGVPHAKPLYTVRVTGAVQAGAWKEAIEWPVDEQYAVAVPVPKQYARFNKFAFEVIGPSMNAVYSEGTVLVCVSLMDLERDPKHKERVIVQRRNRHGMVEASVKELRIDERGAAWLWPRSTHPEFQAPLRLDSPDNEDIQALALVIGSYRDEG